MHSEIIEIGDLVGTFTAPVKKSNQIVYLLHGLGGHRDYCYQKLLAEALSDRLGLCTFRFDFRGCGDSGDVPDPQIGRSVLGSDQQDLNKVMAHFADSHSTLCIIGHSRGVAIMFAWALANSKPVPYWVNCSGRFDCTQIWDRLETAHPHLRADNGYWSKAKRHGKQQLLWYPVAEIQEYADLKTIPYANVSGDILTVFGDADHVVPTTAAGDWANLFGDRHTLKIVPGDHNFYGKVEGKHTNYNPQVVEEVCTWLKAQMAAQLPTTISASRWQEVQGVANLRDFGGYRCANSGVVKTGILFRSANLNKITSLGKQQLVDLGITDIFDLRSPAELTRDRVEPMQLHGVTVHACPVFETQDWSPAAIVARTAKLETGLVQQYEEILEALITSNCLSVVVKALVADKQILIHCTAGKDRTGILCALILLALGVDDINICRDYELTTIGYRSERERLSGVLQRLMPTASAQILENMLGSRFETMFELLKLVRDRGGVEQIFHSAGIGAQIAQLRSKLVVQVPRL